MIAAKTKAAGKGGLRSEIQRITAIALSAVLLLLFRFKLHKMALSSAYVFYCMLRVPPPYGGTCMMLGYLAFPVGSRALELAISLVIVGIRGMRMHFDFLPRWDSNVEYTDLVIVEEHFVGLRPSRYGHRVLRQSR